MQVVREWKIDEADAREQLDVRDPELRLRSEKPVGETTSHRERQVRIHRGEVRGVVGRLEKCRKDQGSEQGNHSPLDPGGRGGHAGAVACERGPSRPARLKRRRIAAGPAPC